MREFTRDRTTLLRGIFLATCDVFPHSKQISDPTFNMKVKTGQTDILPYTKTSGIVSGYCPITF